MKKFLEVFGTARILLAISGKMKEKASLTLGPG
jgi:hypothetical protein